MAAIMNAVSSWQQVHALWDAEYMTMTEKWTVVGAAQRSIFRDFAESCSQHDSAEVEETNKDSKVASLLNAQNRKKIPVF